MNIVLTGPKCSGKSSIGKKLAEKFSLNFVETDSLIEELYFSKSSVKLNCRSICAEIGDDKFRELEKDAVNNASSLDWCVISTGGSTMLNSESRKVLRKNSLLILLYSSINDLLKRLDKKNIPAFLNNSTARSIFSERAKLVIDLITPYADCLINSENKSEEETFNEIFDAVSCEINLLKSKSYSIYSGCLERFNLNQSSQAQSGLLFSKYSVEVIVYTTEIGEIKINSLDYKLIVTNDLFCPDFQTLPLFEKQLLDAKKKQRSLKGKIKIEISGLPPGIRGADSSSLEGALSEAIFNSGFIKSLSICDCSEDSAQINGSMTLGGSQPRTVQGKRLDGIICGHSTGNKISLVAEIDDIESLKSCDTKILSPKLKLNDAVDSPCIIPKIIPIVKEKVSAVLLASIMSAERNQKK